MMLLFVYLVFTIWLNTGLSECGISEPYTCPIWMHYDTDINKCKCGKSIGGAVKCNTETFYDFLKAQFCVIFSEELKFNTTLISTCPYGVGGILAAENNYD